MKKAWMFLVAALSMSVLGVEPKISMTVPVDGKKDVRIQFYVDAHRHNKEANMWYDNSQAYRRAFNAIGGMLSNIKNPISAGLKKRGIGNNVEVNTGTGYLLLPGQVPVVGQPLSKPLEAIRDLPRESGAWSRDVLIRNVLTAIDASVRNVVAIIITNDPDLRTKQGRFYLEPERCIAFFMLHAPLESVKHGWLGTAWNEERWGKFISESVDANANDIANAIVNDFYELTSEEYISLYKISVEPRVDGMVVSGLRNLPKKTMWDTRVEVNGECISCTADIFCAKPQLGLNAIVISMISPTGVVYERRWAGEAFHYDSLSEKGELLREMRACLEGVKKYNIADPVADELRNYLATPEKLYLKTVIEALRGKTGKVQKLIEQVWRQERLEYLRKVVSTALARIDKMDRNDVEKRFQTKRQSFRATILNQKRADASTSSAAQIEEAIRRAEDFMNAPEVRFVEDEILKILKGRTLDEQRAVLLEDVALKVEEVKVLVTGKTICLNIGDLDGFKKAAEVVKTEEGLEDVRRRLKEWKPVIAAKENGLSEAQKLARKDLDDKIRGIHEEACFNFDELEAFRKKINDAQDAQTVFAIRQEIAKWHPKPLEDAKSAFGRKLAAALAEVGNSDAQITNRAELVAFANRLGETVDIAGFCALTNAFSRWRPFTLDMYRKAIDQELVGLLENPELSAERIENRSDLESYLSELRNAADVQGVREVARKRAKWEPIPKEVNLFKYVLFVLVVFVVVWILKPFGKAKIVGWVSYKPAESTDEALKAELKANSKCRLNDTLKCPVNVLVMVRKNEDGQMEIALTSPNKTVWVKLLGGDQRREIASLDVVLDPGEYQLYTDEYAIAPTGTIGLNIEG